MAIDKSLKQHYNVPNTKKIKGQLHSLAYITAKEVKALKKMGGEEVITDSGIPAYPPPGERGGPGSGSEGRAPSGEGRGEYQSPAPARHHPAVDTSAQIAAQAAADELNRQNEMRDLIAQQQQEKDYIDIISKTTAPGTGTTSELQGQLKLDEYQEPNTGIDKLVGGALNIMLPGAGYLYGLESNPYKASNFFAGTGIQDLDREALLSGYVSPEDAAAYQAGTYGQPTGGGEGPPPVTGGGGPDVMPTTPITTAQVPPVLPAGGINTLPVNNNQTAGYTDQQDFLDNIYRENLLDFFKGTGYTGLYG